MWAERLGEQLDQMCVDALDGPEFKRYHARPITWIKYRVRQAAMKRFFAPTNRDCWGYVMGAAPIDVKQAIWRHEQDELVFDARLGRAHVRLNEYEDMLEKLTPEERAVVEAVDWPPGVTIAMFARAKYARDAHWLSGLAASHIMERINDPSRMRGRSSGQRFVEAATSDLQVSLQDLSASTQVHLVADEEHATLIWEVFERYVQDQESYDLVVQGARMGLDCFRLYAGAVAEVMASVVEPAAVA